MRGYLIISILLIFMLRASSQEYVLQGEIHNLGDGKVYLSAWHKGEFIVIDSSTSSRGSFHFIFPTSGHPGLYSLEFGLERGNSNPNEEGLAFEFLFNNENIELFASDVFNIHGSGGIVNSVENEIYFAYLEMQYYYRNDSIGPSFTEYQLAVKNHSLAEAERMKFIAMQERWDDYLLNTAKENPNLFVSHILMASRFPIIDPEEGGWDILKHRFFEKSPMDDLLMLNHPQYINRINDFLGLYYLGSNADTILPEEAYQNAIDIIMANVSHEPELRSFIVEYLLERFAYFDREMAQVYIAENYLDESCESDIVELVLSRMEGYKRMQTGFQAPDFVVKDMRDRTYRLSRMDNTYVLLMFWASTCDHCQKLLPQLHEWYLAENTLDLEIVAISIDTTAYQWEAFISQQNPGWISVFEPLGWNGKVPGDYNVYATPSLFLLDSNRKILSKPFTYREFLKAIKKL